DLTQRARDGKIDPLIGRAEELERMIQVLSRRRKNNPLLIGEPGVGKTAIAEGLALRIVEGKVPAPLRESKVYSLDMTAVLARTRGAVPAHRQRRADGARGDRDPEGPEEGLRGSPRGEVHGPGARGRGRAQRATHLRRALAGQSDRRDRRGRCARTAHGAQGS